MSEIQLNVQDILNKLQAKLTDAQMAETYAEARAEAWEKRAKELEQVVSDLNLQLDRSRKPEPQEHQVVEVD